jgi:hypothetical protein
MVASGMGAVVGGLLGAIVGALAARIVHNWQGMWEWEQLYDAARIVT